MLSVFEASTVDFGLVRAMTLITASGCFSGWGTSVDGNGKESSSILKKTGDVGSRRCLAASSRLSCSAWTIEGARNQTSPPELVLTGMAIDPPQSRIASSLISMP